MPRIAMTACIRNEEEFLPVHLSHHRALGVERAYIYLDRCTDRSADLLAAFDWVTVIRRDQGEGPAQLALHQMHCADDALQRARAEGMDWLLMTDADEFSWGGEDLPAAGAVSGTGRLAALAESAARGTEAIQLRSAEVLVAASEVGLPVTRLRHVQVGDPVVRPILDPLTGETRVVARWIGHRLGKSMVRTACDAQAFDSHSWTRRQGVPVPQRLELRTEARGWSIHFVVTSAAHWLRKYRHLAQEPGHWLRGEVVEFPKQAWKQAAREMTDDEAAAYFRDWIAVPEPLIRSALADGRVREIAPLEAIHRGGG